MSTSRPDADNLGAEYCYAALQKQEHVFRWWNELTTVHRDQLCGQMQQIDLELLHRLYDQTPVDDGRLALHPIP
ncbi:MAG TPA: hypothetical protein VE890_06080, partial [Thermoguttaceae bacterium]|nr:hypothetical protein [Thermoguttaceae bacterium]